MELQARPHLREACAGGVVGESCRCCGCTAASRNASDADKAPGEKRAAAAGTRLPPPVRVGTLGAHSRHHHDLPRAGTARRSASNARREPSLPIAADGPRPEPGPHKLHVRSRQVAGSAAGRAAGDYDALARAAKHGVGAANSNARAAHLRAARAHQNPTESAAGPIDQPLHTQTHTHRHTHKHAHTRTEPFHRSRLLEICVPAPPARAAPFRRLTASTRTRCTSLSTDRTRCSPPHTCAPGSATCASTRCESCAGRSEGLSARLGSIAIGAPTGSLPLAQPATARRTWKMPLTQHPRRHEKTLLPSNLHCSR